MSIIPKTIYKLNGNLSKFNGIFLEKEKNLIFVFLFVRDHKRIWIAKTIQKKWNKARGIKLYKAIVIINIMILVLKQSYLDPWSRSAQK